MRLALFTVTFSPRLGGLERITELIARHAAQLGHDVQVVTNVPADPAIPDGEFPFRVIRTRSFKDRLRAFRQSDVVLFMNVSFAGLPPALLAGRKIVFSHHSEYVGAGLKRAMLEETKRQLTRLFPNISVSTFIAQRLPAPSVVIQNAYDDAIFRRGILSTKHGDFVFCGRLRPEKGADLLLDAFAQVVRAYPAAKLTLVGDGPEKGALLGQVDRLGLRGQVRFAGALNGKLLAEELSRHACMVVPSRWEEPFGIVALEGVACCDTVIVSRRGGLPEAIGDCGVAVDLDATAMAKVMIEVMSARAAGLRLPGQPDDDVRAKHLARHQVNAVSEKYLEVCAAA